MLEKEIERELTKCVKEKGGMCLKQTGMAGIPDRLILLLDGKCGFVELKAPGEKPRKLQEHRMKELREIGYLTFVVSMKDEINGVLKAIENGGKRNGV